MDIQSVVARLVEATEASRRLDGAIAQVIGWKKHVQRITDQTTGDQRSKVLWVVPTGEDYGQVPFYTSNLQDAYDLAQSLFPGQVAGCCWENGTASAKINDGPYVQAATPAIALCIAALSLAYEAEKYP